MKRMAEVIGLVFCACTLLAQAPEMPKPQPEHHKLHYFVGEWKNEGTMKPSPMGPGGKFTGTDHNEMLGDFFVVLHSDGSTPMGQMNEIAVMGYDPKEKVYTYNGFDNMGEHERSEGTISGDTWTWLSPEQEMGGKRIKGRFTIKEVSASEYTYKYDVSTDGGPWTNVMDGKATKTK